MPLYRCTIAEKNGDRHTVFREAESISSITRSYSTGELFLINAIQTSGNPNSVRKFKPAVIRDFTSMISTLIGSGLLIKDALQVALEIIDEKENRYLIEHILKTIRKGQPFSSAIDQFKESFPPIYRGMVRIGEKVGTLESIFPRLHIYLTNKKALREKILSAMMYPMLVFIVAIVGSIGIMAFLIPSIIEMFTQLGGPAAARIAHNVMVMNIAFYGLAATIIITLSSAVITSLLRRKNQYIRIKIDKAIISFPIIGKILIAFENLNFCFAMETLITGGISVESGMLEATSVIGNFAYRQAFERAHDDVVKGESLSHALQKHPIVPTYISRWIAIGERTGHVERVFGELKTYYQTETDRTLSRFMALVEPALILLVGGMVLLLVLFFIVPLFSMYGSIV